MPRAEEIVSIIEGIAPSNLAESWDNSGWQVGNPKEEIDKIMVALDLDKDVVDEAISKNVRMIITHHPFIMKNMRNIRLDTLGGEILYNLINNKIAVYSAHTNLDSAAGGLNDVLSQKLDLQNTRVLHVAKKDKYYKLVVFVPQSHLEQVMEALRRTGAGWIGDYSDCTFQVKGTGTFRPGESTNPFIGNKGELERVEEVRLETIVLAENVKKVVSEMVDSHPYEEVAYDLYPLKLEGREQGLGRVGRIDSPVKFSEFVEVVKDKLNISNLRYGGNGSEEICNVAVCCGSGASLWSLALSHGADVLVTGDVKYHEAKDMLSEGLKFIDAGHYGTEKTVVEFLSGYLREVAEKNNMNIKVVQSQSEADPFKYT